jgi:acetyl-CoA carboxylase carboxyl transferase subunit beta
MSWLKKKKTGITTQTQDKKEVPGGLFLKCDGCGEILYQPELEAALWTCPRCSHHFRIKSADYITLLVDPGSFDERFTDLEAEDPLQFRDARMRYPERYDLARKATGLNDAVRTGPATIEGTPVALAVMDFFFMAGSMGSVLGEKVARTIELAVAERRALVIVTASGGARMQEGILSLMQMAKTSALLATLKEARLPFLSILVDPSMAGVMASYASLGDVILAEPGALIGFAGPRVIQDTIGEELPPGFQRSDFVLDHGMVDSVVHRKDMREAAGRILGMLWQGASALPPAAVAVDATYRP